MILHFDEQANIYRALDSWFMTPQGHRVAHAFLSEFMPVNDQINGQTLLQLGSCGENIWLPNFKFRDKWIINPCVIPQKTSTVASLTMLPLERDSIDCIIAPLTLEAFERAKNPIDEIDRVLKPMGYVIFIGINPLSLWGLACRLHSLSCFGHRRGTLTSSLTIKRMMLLRGFRQCAFTSFYYIPPVKNESLIKKLEFLNEMGKMVWPFPAGFYCFIVQKFQECAPSLQLNRAKAELVLQQHTSLQPINSRSHSPLQRSTVVTKGIVKT